MKNILLLELKKPFARNKKMKNYLTLFQIDFTLSILITGKVLVTVYFHFHVI